MCRIFELVGPTFTMDNLAWPPGINFAMSDERIDDPDTDELSEAPVI